MSGLPAAQLRALSVAACAIALVACGGGSSSNSGSSSSGSGSSGSAGIYTVLYSFGASGSDGVNPGGLILGSDGNFYGTTSRGGSSDDGTIYRITPDGTETVLYDFGSVSGDGENPYAGLIQGSDGNFYGTTYYGGTDTSCKGGCGTIFEFSPGSGTETVLYDFGSVSGDGENPYAGVIQGSDGNFYGTTYYGGIATSCSGCGTIFKFSPGSGTETVLYNFGSVSGDGENPYAGVIQGSDGNFYGTTTFGGTSSTTTTCNDGCGTIFEFSPGSGTETVLYNFGHVSDDGAYPYAGLIQGSDGDFYGTTPFGGTGTACNNRCGTIFEFSPASGTETVLYDFGSVSGDGENPYAGVIQGGDGNFYGTTLNGGTAGDGAFWKITP